MDQKVGNHKAENVTITDSGNLYDATEVEATLQEIAFKIVDDGTYWIFQTGSTKILKVRKSDGQLFLAGGVNTDESL